MKGTLRLADPFLIQGMHCIAVSIFFSIIPTQPRRYFQRSYVIPLLEIAVTMVRVPSEGLALKSDAV